MKRHKLLTLLEQFHPSDQEIPYKEQIISFVKENENCFERSLSIGHITASAWLLDHTGKRALLMHHRKLDNWFQLGGHCDGDGDMLRVAIKEAEEESGLEGIIAIDNGIFDVDVHQIPQNPREEAHFHYDIRFLLQVPTEQDLVINSESKELRWINKTDKDLPTNSDSVVRMFYKWQKIFVSDLVALSTK